MVEKVTTGNATETGITSILNLCKIQAKFLEIKPSLFQLFSHICFTFYTFITHEKMLHSVHTVFAASNYDSMIL